MSFIHKDVSLVCQGTHAASGNKTLSLFLRTQISKNGGTTELIQICVRYDVGLAISTEAKEEDKLYIPSTEMQKFHPSTLSAVVSHI